MRNFRSSLRSSSCSTDVDNTSHLAAALLQEIPGNVLWYMTDSITVLEDGYSEVVVNVMTPCVEVAALLADVGRPHMMTTNSTGDHLYFCNCEHETWQCFVYIAKRFEGAYS